MSGQRRAAAAIVAILLSTAASATMSGEPPPASPENQDLELIPEAARQSPKASSTGAAPAQRIYVEDALTLSSRREALPVPVPPPPPFDWQDRLFLDVRREWSLGDAAQFHYSGRLNLRAENDISFPDHENLINDLREVYASFEPADRTFLEIGRINLKSGVALGFNPTDYFKSRAVVEPLSLDPSVLKEDRLGTLMLQAQEIFEHGALTAALAPAVRRPSPIYTNLDLPSFNPMLDRTNASTRVLLKGSFSLDKDLSPELLLYRDGSQTKGGINLTRNLGQRVIGYLEGSAGRGTNLVDEAFQFGRQTGSLPAGAPTVLPDETNTRLEEQLAIGVSYTTESRITFNIEYELNQAAFTNRVWEQWFSAGSGQGARSASALELWLIRDYALDQEEPISRNSLFLRADWVDAFIPKLELVGLVAEDFRDGSALLQLGGDYFLSDHWTVGGLVIGYLGSRRSDFGSLPLEGSVLVKVARYF